MMHRTVLAICLSFLLSQTSVAETTASQLLKQAEQGDPVAQYALGKILYERCDGSGKKWLELFIPQATKLEREGTLSETGLHNISITLGKAYYMLSYLYYRYPHPREYLPPPNCKSNSEWPLDQMQARDLLFKAAELGNRSAQYDLAGMYEAGVGVPQDYLEAIRWYKKLAEDGNDSAFVPLGELSFKTGDFINAHMWFNLAASAQGRNKEAEQMRDRIASRLAPRELMDAQKKASEWKNR